MSLRNNFSRGTEAELAIIKLLLMHIKLWWQTIKTNTDHNDFKMKKSD